MRRLSRRQLLIGGAGGAGLFALGGAAALLGRRDDAGESPAATMATTGPTPLPAATPSVAGPRGGVARVLSLGSLKFDTFDALRAGEPSVLDVLGYTHMRLVDWADARAAVLGPGLAASWEQPHDDRLILHLAPGAAWHDRPPLDGSPVTADQVAAHLRRAVELAQGGGSPGIQRSHDYITIDRVASDNLAHTVEIRLSSPDAFILPTLASRFALIQPPEAVEAFAATWRELRPESVIGCGPFVYEGRSQNTLRFAAHRAGHRPPLLDDLMVSEPDDLLARFREKLIDEAILRDRRHAPQLLAEFGSAISVQPRFEDSPLISTFVVDVPPWNNPLLRRGLSAALNRRELASRLFGGRAPAAGPVTPAQEAFALTEAELAPFPGYHPDTTADVADARRMWDAGGGPALGPVSIDLPSVFDPVYSASSVLTGMLREALGVEAEIRIATYATIAERVADRAYGNGQLAFWFGWGPALVEPDPSRTLIEAYHSSSPTASAAGFASPDLDRDLASLRTRTRLDERKETVKQIQRALLQDAAVGITPWLLQQSDAVRWSYFQAQPPTPFWSQHNAAGWAIKPAERSFQGRPS